MRRKSGNPRSAAARRRRKSRQRRRQRPWRQRSPTSGAAPQRSRSSRRPQVLPRPWHWCWGSDQCGPVKWKLARPQKSAHCALNSNLPGMAAAAAVRLSLPPAPIMPIPCRKTFSSLLYLRAATVDMDVDAPAAPAAAEAAPAPAAAPAADTPAPKKRGRPPGSRNKPKGEPCHAPEIDFHHLGVLLSTG